MAPASTSAASPGPLFALPGPLQDALQTVEDETPLTQADEPAYYGLLAHLQSADLQQLAEAARQGRLERERTWRDPQGRAYSQHFELLARSSEFRGRPVIVQGHIRRAVAFEADANPHGLTRLYEFWLFTEDGQQLPTVIVSATRPPGIPMGEQLVQRVTVAGVFLKTWLYPARDKQSWKCPLILAGSITVAPPVESPALLRWISFNLVLVTLLIAGLAVWARRSSARLAANRRPAAAPFEAPPPGYSPWAEPLNEPASPSGTPPEHTLHSARPDSPDAAHPA